MHGSDSSTHKRHIHGGTGRREFSKGCHRTVKVSPGQEVLCLTQTFPQRKQRSISKKSQNMLHVKTLNPRNSELMNQKPRSKFKKKFSPTVSNQSFLEHLLLDLLGSSIYPFSLLSLCRTTQVDPLLLTPLPFDTWYIVLFLSSPALFVQGTFPHIPLTLRNSLFCPVLLSLQCLPSPLLRHAPVSSTPPLSSLLPSPLETLLGLAIKSESWRKQPHPYPTFPSASSAPLTTSQRCKQFDSLPFSAFSEGRSLILTSNLQRDGKNNLGHKVNRGAKGWRGGR